MTLKHNHKSFINEVRRRNIKYLIHFTPTRNLYSILELNKILSRSRLENLGIEQFDILDLIEFPDKIRYDDKNYINLSLSGPNTYLFSRFIERTRNDPTINWCVLMINPKHIYDHDTLFSVTNAASNSAKNQFGISGDFTKFNQMFSYKLEIESNNGKRTLFRHRTLDHYTTDEQAEILVKDTIPIDSIINVCFQTKEELAQAKAAMSEFRTTNFIVNPEIFNPKRQK